MNCAKYPTDNVANPFFSLAVYCIEPDSRSFICPYCKRSYVQVARILPHIKSHLIGKLSQDGLPILHPKYSAVAESSGNPANANRLECRF